MEIPLLKAHKIWYDKKAKTNNAQVNQDDVFYFCGGKKQPQRCLRRILRHPRRQPEGLSNKPAGRLF